MIPDGPLLTLVTYWVMVVSHITSATRATMCVGAPLNITNPSVLLKTKKHITHHAMQDVSRMTPGNSKKIPIILGMKLR